MTNKPNRNCVSHILGRVGLCPRRDLEEAHRELKSADEALKEQAETIARLNRRVMVLEEELHDCDTSQSAAMKDLAQRVKDVERIPMPHRCGTCGGDYVTGHLTGCWVSDTLAGR